MFAFVVFVLVIQY